MISDDGVAVRHGAASNGAETPAFFATFRQAWCMAGGSPVFS
jgi:hypothetical protein